MKKIANAVKSLLVLFALASCSGNNESNKDTPIENSGTVNVYMPSPAGLQTNLEKGFETAYQGIDMKVTSGTTGELLAKIEAEKNAPVCDVLILASWSDGLNNLSKLDLLSYEPKGSEKLSSGYKEASHKIYGTSASAVGVIYNTDRVKKEEIEKLDWTDYAVADKVRNVTLNGEMPSMSIPDPTKSGAAKDFFAGWLTSTNGAEGNYDDKTSSAYSTIQGWKNNGLTNGGGNKTVIANVEGSDLDILLAGVDYNAFADSKKGKHIGFYIPKSGSVINARPAMILSTGSNTENAKKVMDYLCSDEAQRLVSDAYLIPGNSSIKMNAARATVKEMDSLDWNLMKDKGTAIANNIVNILKA